MKSDRRIVGLMLLCGALLSACSSGAPADSAVDPNAIVTSIAGTLVEQHFSTQTALVATASAPPTLSPTTTPLIFTFPPTPLQSATPTYLVPTFPIYPTVTPSATGTLNAPTMDPNLPAYGCKNLAFVTDMNVPPGTDIMPGAQFVKTWKVSNRGTCSWLDGYALVPLAPSLPGAQTTLLNMQVAPGQSAEVSTSVTAPSAGGDYTAYWRMADADGHPFGATLVLSFTVSPNPAYTPPP